MNKEDYNLVMDFIAETRERLSNLQIWITDKLEEEKELSKKRTTNQPSKEGKQGEM